MKRTGGCSAACLKPVGPTPWRRAELRIRSAYQDRNVAAGAAAAASFARGGDIRVPVLLQYLGEPTPVYLQERTRFSPRLTILNWLTVAAMRKPREPIDDLIDALCEMRKRERRDKQCEPQPNAERGTSAGTRDTSVTTPGLQGGVAPEIPPSVPSAATLQSSVSHRQR